MLHPQAERVVALWAQGASFDDPGFDIDAERAAARELGLADDRPDVAYVADLSADGVPCRLYRPSEGAPLLIHLHGGGFVFGDLETHDAHCRLIANASGWAVLAVDYRRAPEHAYPAASDDVDTVIAWATANAVEIAVEAQHLGVVGDSAGGQLALVAAMRHPGRFAAAALVYPCIDPSGRFPSFTTNYGGLSTGEMTWYWDCYAPDRAVRSHPELNPLDADLSSMPPTLVISAEHDILVDEDEALADKLARAGVPTTGVRYLGMIHGFFRHAELFDAAPAAIDQVAAFLRSQPHSHTVGAD